MNADTANSGVIVCEPNSPSKPPSLSSRPSTPISTYTFPRPLTPSKSAALKANPHPYPIRTTSTGILSRSNSTASPATTAHPHQYHYQYYVPQSPSKESPSNNGETRRGGRHRYSKSLTNPDSVPKPLPAPSMTTSHRNRSMSSLSSSEDEEEEDLATGNKKRGRRCRGGKVSGIVASFEERRGPEAGNEEGYGRKYRRERAESDASSVSSASSFGSFTDVKADDDGVKLGSEPLDIPKRDNVENQGEEEEPTIEELLASTAGDPTPDGAVYDETVKVRSADIAYSTVTASSIRYSLPIPTFSSSRNSVLERLPNPDDELSVEELLASVGSGSAVGASAWERNDVGCCTVKRVGDVDLDAGRREEKKLAPPMSPTPISEREQGLVQDMSETREMVRALSARVASVEAKIGEMEIVAGELEVRGRQLLVQEAVGDDDHPPQGQSLPRRVASTLYRTVFGASLVRMVFPSRSSPKSRSREPSQPRAVLPMWYKRSWACYLLFLGLGACAFVLREVVKRGMMLRGRRT